MNILFVCKYNRFRSKIAEAYFKKVTKGFSVKSAGIIKGRPIRDSIRKAAKRHGLSVTPSRQGLESKLLHWCDVVVIVADNVPPSIFCNTDRGIKEIIVWKIHDSTEDSVKGQDRIIKSIKKRIDAWVKKLKKN
jgi:protein-tyrosine-phosphatase